MYWAIISLFLLLGGVKEKIRSFKTNSLYITFIDLVFLKGSFGSPFFLHFPFGSTFFSSSFFSFSLSIFFLWRLFFLCFFFLSFSIHFLFSFFLLFSFLSYQLLFPVLYHFFFSLALRVGDKNQERSCFCFFFPRSSEFKRRSSIGDTATN